MVDEDLKERQRCSWRRSQQVDNEEEMALVSAHMYKLPVALHVRTKKAPPFFRHGDGQWKYVVQTMRVVQAPARVFAILLLGLGAFRPKSFICGVASANRFVPPLLLLFLLREDRRSG